MTKALQKAAAKAKTVKPLFKKSEEVEEMHCDICKELRPLDLLEKTGTIVQCVDEEKCLKALQPKGKRNRTPAIYAGCE